MNALFVMMVALGAGLVFASLRRIPEDTVCTVHRFGRYVRTLSPGFRFTLPFVDHIAHRVRLVGHQVELPLQPFAAGQAARGAVYYQILDPQRAGEALDEVDALVEREAQTRLAAIAHDAVARTECAALDSQLKAELNERFGTLGLRITRCQLHLTAV